MYFKFYILTSLNEGIVAQSPFITHLSSVFVTVQKVFRPLRIYRPPVQVKLSRGINTSEASSAYIVDVLGQCKYKGVSVVLSSKRSVGRCRVVILESKRSQGVVLG